LTQSVVGRVIAEKLVGIDRRIPIPRLARQSFRATYVDRATVAPRKKRDAAVDSNAAGTPAGGKRCEEPARRKAVVLFVDTWTDYFRPEAGTAALRVLEWLGYDVIVPDTTCCGRPAISKGMLHEAKRLAERNATALADHAADGIPIVGLEPSCVSALMDELPQLVRSDLARRIAESAMMIETFLARHIEIGPDGRPTFRGAMDGRRLFPNSDQKQPSMLYHGHCHQKALVGTADAMSVLTAIAHVKEIDSGCCGMAGSFGHEKEHYEVARAIGEQRLFPAIRARGDAVIAVSGFSCLHQIAHHAGVEPRHIVEYLAEALPKPSVVPNRKFRGTD
jgi:Fe-S oxidoreductase